MLPLNKYKGFQSITFRSTRNIANEIEKYKNKNNELIKDYIKNQENIIYLT